MKKNNSVSETDTTPDDWPARTTATAPSIPTDAIVTGASVIPDDWRSRTTVDVPTAGAIAGGLCRNSSYVAAKRGDLPTITLGRRIVVPVIPLRRMLGELPEIAEQGGAA